MQDKKNGETRCETKKRGDKTQDGKKMGKSDKRQKNGETRCKTKIYKKKNGEMRQDMEKKWGDEMRDEKKMGR